MVQTELATIFILVVPGSLGMLPNNLLLHGYTGKCVWYPKAGKAARLENFRWNLEYFCLLIE